MIGLMVTAWSVVTILGVLITSAVADSEEC